MSTSPVWVIANPAASGGRGRWALSPLVEELERRAIEHVVRRTGAPGDAIGLAVEAMEAEATRILVVGGDGTIHEVAQGLLGGALRDSTGGAVASVVSERDTEADGQPGESDVTCPLSPPWSQDELPAIVVCPVGTGNDFYRMVDPGRSGRAPEDVIDLLENGTVEHFDVGQVRHDDGIDLFVNLLGVGVDVAVLRCRPRFRRLPGLAQYLAAFLTAVVTFRPPAIEVEVNGGAGERLVGPTILSVLTVGPSLGGGFMINPDASWGDGKLDLCHIPALRWYQIAHLLPKVVRGKHGSSSLVTMRQVEEVTIRAESGEALPFELDGELAPKPSRELAVRLLPAALPVVVPSSPVGG